MTQDWCRMTLSGKRKLKKERGKNSSQRRLGFGTAGYILPWNDTDVSGCFKYNWGKVENDFGLR